MSDELPGWHRFGPEEPSYLKRCGLACREQRCLRTRQAQIMGRADRPFYHAHGVAAELRKRMLAASSPRDSQGHIAWLYAGSGGAEIASSVRLVVRMLTG